MGLDESIKKKVKESANDTRILRNLKELSEALHAKEKASNTISTVEFRKFEPLFRASSKDSSEDLTTLSQEFFDRFDVYSNISVINPATNEVVVTLPKLFIPVNSIDEKMDGIVSNFHAEGSSDIPKYASKATSDMLKALVVSQSSNEKEYVKVVKDLREEYKNINLDFIRFRLGGKAKVVDEPEATKEFDIADDDDFEWE